MLAAIDFIKLIYFNKPKLISQISTIYGSQSIVASLDFKFEDKKYFIFVENGKVKIKKDTKKIVKKILSTNIGEIIIRSIDRDGSGMGLDFDLLSLLPKNTNKNIILAGGCGNARHIEEGLLKDNVSAVCTGNLFNFINEELKTVREKIIMKKFNLPTWKFKEIKKYNKIFNG